MIDTKTESPTRVPVQRVVRRGVFAELKHDCLHRKDWQNDAGGTMSDCKLHDSGKEPPCCPEICPLFESDDPNGDYDNMRTDEEVEGSWQASNVKDEPRGRL